MAANAGSSTVDALVERPSGSVWTHVKAACDHNCDLSDRVLWCLGVDWRRACAKLGISSRLDTLFHVALCWEWWAVAHYRLAYWVHKRKMPELGRHRLLANLLFLQQAVLLRLCYATGKIVEALSGARINALAEIGPGLLLAHTGSCGIGIGVTIGANFTLYQDANVVVRHGREPTVIGDNVTVYSGARIAGNLRIGDGVSVGANALVLHDLPAGCLAVGVPARPVSNGEHPPPYPASHLVRDLIDTLIQQGTLRESAPGHYADSATGESLEISFAEVESDIATRSITP